ncbi:MAG TPA: hypothetical protein VFC63_14935, partial [Blastocatellia bacterium]|nr:hypothetical protein [Blastocatellia bacterium]
MLLNEFLKEHRKNEEQEAVIAELKSAVASLTAMVRDQTNVQKAKVRFQATNPVANNSSD